MATWCKEPTYCKRSSCWERLMAKGEVGDRGCDGGMTSLTQWTWIWINWGLVKGRGAWHAATHGISKSWTKFSNWKMTYNRTTEWNLGKKCQSWMRPMKKRYFNFHIFTKSHLDIIEFMQLLLLVLVVFKKSCFSQESEHG